MIESFLTIYFLATLKPQDFQLQGDTAETSHIEQIFNMNVPFSKKPYYIAPVLNAKSVLAVDKNSDTILFQKKINEEVHIASLTKLMTAYIILKENKLDEIVTVSQKAVDTPGSKIWLYPNEKITIENLLYGLLIPSGNDVAVALAEHNADTVEAFVAKMNFQAEKLGMTQTRFENPTGLDTPMSYSTANDLLILTKEILKFPIVPEITKLKNYEITSYDGNLKHKLETTNNLLGSYLSVKGLKTGLTDLAGECFIGITETKKNQDIITIILGSPNRFQETKVLIDWIERAYDWNK